MLSMEQYELMSDAIEEVKEWERSQALDIKDDPAFSAFENFAFRQMVKHERATIKLVEVDGLLLCSRGN